MTHRLFYRPLDPFRTPEQVFLSLVASRKGAFWLDNSFGALHRMGFSFMGAPAAQDPAPWLYEVTENRLYSPRDHGVASSGRTGPLLPFLRDLLRKRQIAVPDDYPLPFAGGLVGYFGYEMTRQFTGQNLPASDLPDAGFYPIDEFIGFDHAQQKAFLAWVAPADDPNPSAWGAQVLARWTDLADIPPPPPSPWMAPAPIEFTLREDRGRYLRLIANCLDYIRAGESYELCLTNLLTTATRPDPLSLYRYLRNCNPAPYAAFMDFPHFVICSASPEKFMTLDRDGWIESKPIKGTAPRDADPAHDHARKQSLATDAKTRAENLMIVDLLRNDLGKVCDVGSVDVASLMHVETYATMHQLVSTIRGHLRSGLGALDALAALFPGGSMTGAPKYRTVDLLASMEQSARGIYSGALGYLSYDGAADFSIVIRTAVIDSARTSIGIGGAIVADSDPEQEFLETLLKGKALMMALAEACGHSPDSYLTIGQ